MVYDVDVEEGGAGLRLVAGEVGSRHADIMSSGSHLIPIRARMMVP